MSYIPYDTSPKEQTGDINTFAKFEEGNLPSETRNDTESSNKYDDDLTLTTLIGFEEMDVMSSGNESDAEPMSTDMLEYICDGSQSNPSINIIKARYKICGHLKNASGMERSVIINAKHGQRFTKVF